jgi:hypothetical protein
MKKRVDSELSEILQRKLKNLEADVPDDSEKFIFDAIKAERRTWFSRKRISMLILIVSIPATWYIIQNTSNHAPLAGAGNTIDGLLEQEKLGENKENHAMDMASAIKTNSSVTHPQVMSKAHNPSSKVVGSINEEQTHSDEFVTLRKENDQFVQERNSANPKIFSLIEKTDRDSLLQKNMKEDERTTPSEEKTGTDSTSQERSSKLPKTWLAFSIQPFLNYKIISPIQDGNYLSHFKSPSSLNMNRLGYQLNMSVELQTSARKAVFFGVSWFDYTSTVSYQASETGNGVKTINQINDNIRGGGLRLGTRYLLKSRGSRSQYVRLGVDAVRVLSDVGSPRNNLMLQLGYANHWRVHNNEFRVTPLLSYGLMEAHYPGVNIRPYWVGLEMSYALRLK